MTAELVDQLTHYLTLGMNREEAARRAGVGTRSLYRWVRQGQEELSGLSAEAQLALAVGRAEEWKSAAAQLEAEFPLWAGPEPLEDLLADFRND